MVSSSGKAPFDPQWMDDASSDTGSDSSAGVSDGPSSCRSSSPSPSEASSIGHPMDEEDAVAPSSPVPTLPAAPSVPYASPTPARDPPPPKEVSFQQEVAALGGGVDVTVLRGIISRHSLPVSPQIGVTPV